MADPINNHADDFFALSESFQPDQHAMHGLLSACYYAEHTDQTKRVNMLLARALNGKQRKAGSAPWRRWAIGGLTATCLVVALSAILFNHVEPVLADDHLLRAAASAGSVWLQFLAQADPFLSDDPDALAQRLATLRQAKERRDRGMAALEQSKDPNDPARRDICHPWQAYYCGLRDLGRRDEAITEIRAAIEYTQYNPTGEHWTVWEAVYLDGLGNAYACFGEFAEAREAYRRSIDIRLTFPGETNDPIRSKPGYHGHNAISLAPLYLRLMMVSLAEDDLPQAHDWQAAAERVMCDRLASICEVNGRSLSKGSSIWEAWTSLPPEFREPRESYTAEEQQTFGGFAPATSTVAWVRAILYHRARLHYAEGDYASAKESLDRAAGVRDYATADELRLSFAIPVEYARLAIARKDYAVALQKLDESERFVGQMYVGGEPDLAQAPIAPARRAELQLLRGIAMLGLEEEGPATHTSIPADSASSPGGSRRTEALTLIRKALAIPQKLAVNLSASQREAFLKQFEAWQQLAPSSTAGDLTSHKID